MAQRYDAVCPVAGSLLEGAQRGEIRNPADTGEVVGTFPLLTVEEVDTAVEGAMKAQEAWAALPAVERAAIVAEAGDVIGAIDDLEDLLIREQGKVRWEASFEVGFFEMMATFYAELAPWLDEGDERVDDGMGKLRLFHEPVGVVAAITPWNWPFAISAAKVVPALVAGNALVLKPSPFTPLTVLRAFTEAAEVLPPGLLSVVTGTDDAVSRRLVEHPLVRMVSFTGGTPTGRKVAASAALTLKNVLLELGGNDAALVLEDAEVDEDLCANLVSAAFTTTGQLCFGVKRIYAPEAVADTVAAGVGDVLDQYVVGPGLDDSSSMGPMQNRRQRDVVAGLVEDARGRGATVRECGDLAANPDTGWFLRPVVVTGLEESAPLVQQEQFGPALPVLGYATLDEAVDRVNATEFGLASSVWTADEDRGRAVARDIRAGTTFINTHGLFAIDPRGPFGGVKQSGTGREMATEGLTAYTEPHVVSTRHL